MGIRVTCPNGHTLNVKDHLAGRLGRCPKCGEPVRIPAVSAPGAPVAEEAVASTPPAAPQTAPPQAVPQASAPAPQFTAPHTTAPQTAAPSPGLPSEKASPVVIVAEEPLVARSGVARDPRLVAKRRARQRRLALVVLSVLSLALAALLAWVLLGQ